VFVAHLHSRPGACEGEFCVICLVISGLGAAAISDMMSDMCRQT
jgi:hypothetical protein